MARIELKGLSEAKENFQKLSDQAQREIGRQALRAAANTLAGPMREATYTTFTRRTGAIRAALGVGVHHEPKNDTLTGYVEEYAQSITGALTPFAVLVRKRLSRKRRRSAPTTSIPFWWRFLEFGTKPRKSVRTPKAKRLISLRSGTRSRATWNRFVAAPSRGRITPRPWLQPVFGSTAAQAIQSFREAMLKLIDAAVSAMPK